MKIDGRGRRKTSERRLILRTREASGTHRIQVIAWLSVLLTGLRPVFGTTPPSTTTSVPSRRGETVIYRSFGTATLPTGTSEPSPRGEGVIYRLFGTGTLPTSSSVASPRGKTVIYRSFATAIMPTGISAPSPRGKASSNRSQTGLFPML